MSSQSSFIRNWLIINDETFNWITHDVLRWNDGVIVRLAKDPMVDVYLLLDALEDAGATDPWLLSCRTSSNVFVHQALVYSILKRAEHMSIDLITKRLAEKFPSDPSVPGLLVAWIPAKQLFYVCAQRFTESFGRGKVAVAKAEGPTIEDALRALERAMEA